MDNPRGQLLHLTRLPNLTPEAHSTPTVYSERALSVPRSLPSCFLQHLECTLAGLLHMPYAVATEQRMPPGTVSLSLPLLPSPPVVTAGSEAVLGCTYGAEHLPVGGGGVKAQLLPYGGVVRAQEGVGGLLLTQAAGHRGLALQGRRVGAARRREGSAGVEERQAGATRWGVNACAPFCILPLNRPLQQRASCAFGNALLAHPPPSWPPAYIAALTRARAASMAALRCARAALPGSTVTANLRGWWDVAVHMENGVIKSRL